MDQKFRVASQYISEKIIEAIGSNDKKDIIEAAIALFPLQETFHTFADKLRVMMEEEENFEPPKEETPKEEIDVFAALFGGHGLRS